MLTYLLNGLRQRRKVPELMDQVDLDVDEHRSALQSLARINWISRSANIVAKPIFAAARAAQGTRAAPGKRSLKVLDLASGGGDILASLARQGLAQRLNIEWVGCDVSPVAIQHAQEQATSERLPITFLAADVLNDPLPTDCDVVMCSLFLHHLNDDQAVCLMSRMREAAKQCVLINDLIRGQWGYAMAYVGCRLLTRSAVVHYDGPVSVAGAYTINEVRRLAEQAGLHSASFTRHWPQRFLLTWRRT